VVYFPQGGSVDLYISALSGTATLEWCEVLKAEWTEALSVRPLLNIRLQCPGEGHWIALVKTK